MSTRLIECRGAFDFVSGYKPYHVPDSILAEKPLPIERLRKEGKILSDKQWLLRIIVLESFAGVPGMVGGTLRHLRSLRLLVSLLLHCQPVVERDITVLITG